MNYRNVKDQLRQIIITETAKYYQKSLSPAGLPLEDLKALELLSKITTFEENIKLPKSELDKAATPDEVDSLLLLVKGSSDDSAPGRS